MIYSNRLNVIKRKHKPNYFVGKYNILRDIAMATDIETYIVMHEMCACFRGVWYARTGFNLDVFETEFVFFFSSV